MRPFTLTGHIGADAAALVDGQLDEAEEERAWQHVLCCPGCRRLVEAEGWTRMRLRTLPERDRTGAPSALVGALYAVEAWAEVGRIERSSVRRRAVTAMVGVGSVGAAMLGLVALTSAPAGSGEIPGPAPAMIRSDLGAPTSGPTPPLTRPGPAVPVAGTAR